MRITYCGFIFPNTLLDHHRLLHFAAHVGMSFLLACCVFALCHIRLRISRTKTYIILFATLFVIGTLYKYFEMAGNGMLHRSDSLWHLLLINGYYASMSLNLAGLLGAILLIGYVTDNQQAIWERIRRKESVPEVKAPLPPS